MFLKIILQYANYSLKNQLNETAQKESVSNIVGLVLLCK